MSESETSPKQPEQTAEKKEYNFDQGVSVVVQKIESLLAAGQKYVVVSINGSDVEVGKTHLLAAIAIQLKLKGINVYDCSNSEHIGILKDVIKATEEESPANQIVIIFQADAPTGFPVPKEKIEQERGRSDYSLRQRAEEIGLPLEKIDIRVGIYRPDRPFVSFKGCKIFADIIIRNEQAHNRPYPV